MPVKILLNVERSEALALLDEEGTLLVMCSLIDNMPYVLAEAAVGLRPGLLPGSPATGCLHAICRLLRSGSCDLWPDIAQACSASQGRVAYELGEAQKVLSLAHALQVKGVPLISFDVGGIGEMLEYAEHGDVIVMESTAKALSQKLQGDSP